ncbi:MAG: hypothetical protein KAT56_05640, partial [Sedimentisphaerales bacterium]|nr:hypothetical protein [Sedimentisphaerales bacterium]
MLRFKLKTTILIMAGLTVLLALIAYALLPFWLPTGAIREEMVQRLQSQLGREVSIGDLTVGWSGGTVISNIRVQRRQESEPGLLIKIGRIRCSLEPFSLFRGKISELRIEDAELFI